MATWDIASLLDYFNTILGLLTSGLGGLFFVAVFMPRVRGYAGLIGFIAGEVTVFMIKTFTEANVFTFGLIGMVVCVLIAWIVNLASPLQRK